MISYDRRRWLSLLPGLLGDLDLERDLDLDREGDLDSRRRLQGEEDDVEDDEEDDE